MVTKLKLPGRQWHSQGKIFGQTRHFKDLTDFCISDTKVFIIIGERPSPFAHLAMVFMAYFWGTCCFPKQWGIKCRKESKKLQKYEDSAIFWSRRDNCFPLPPVTSIASVLAIYKDSKKQSHRTNFIQSVLPFRIMLVLKCSFFLQPPPIGIYCNTAK